MAIEETKDLRLIETILTHPSIWDNISQGLDAFSYEHPSLDGWVYALSKDEQGEIVGLYITHPGEYGWKIHANLLPEGRKDSHKRTKEFLDWVEDRIGCEKVYCSIPLEFEHIIKHAYNQGFKFNSVEDGEAIMVKEYGRG